MSELLERINNAVKDAMRNRDQRRLVTLRLATSAVKQQEIDKRTDASRNALTDAEILAVLERMVKQRIDAKEQFEKAGRNDLATQEGYEINIIREFMPEQLSQEELEALVVSAIDVVQPKGPMDMGKVITYLKPRVQGKADMKSVSELVKGHLEKKV